MREGFTYKDAVASNNIIAREKYLDNMSRELESCLFQRVRELLVEES